MPKVMLALRIGFLLLVTGVALAQVKPPVPPEQATEHMKAADGFRVRLVAAEPVVRKPVTMSFDDRGRLWVLQYLQYPSPAGLKPKEVDQYLRTKYDRIPEPPPKGPKGADRISILTDPDENGRFRKSKDVITGLNLATGMCLGYGGVFVAQPPYLLFYKLKEDTDEPVGDPEVLLSGFGMEDSHAFPNSLQWGPDGWLYGAQGSTVTANIRGIEFQQGIWRYHPRTKEFELFAEGGGNTWGVDFDRHGNLIAGTNWGGKAMLHQVQGGYYIKGFGKHGPLHNPYTFGYFDHVPYTGFKGGHVTCGGILYNGGAFPERFNNQYIAANLLSNAIYWHILEPDGSTFKARFGGDLLTSDEIWFRPIDLLVGPDGAVYVVDWCDKRANHVDPVDNWDRTRGRIYKIEYPGEEGLFPRKPLSKLINDQLAEVLGHRNDWYVREARRILAERRDASVLPTLRVLIEVQTDRHALEALWAYYVSGGPLDDENALQFLAHANDDVRTWTVRLLGDAKKKLSQKVHDRVIALARSHDGPAFCCQLACTAKRLPATDALPILRELITRKEFANDPQFPLLLWWAIESKAASDRDGVLALFAKPDARTGELARQFLIERLARRYLMAGGEDDLRSCARLLEMAPHAEDARLVIIGMEKALEGRHLPKVPAALEPHLAKLWTKQPDDPTVLRLALRLGSPPAFDRALQRIVDPHAPSAERAALIEIVGQLGKPECVSPLLKMLDGGDAKVQTSALAALQAFADPKIAEAVVALYPKWPAALRAKAQSLLLSRPASAAILLNAVDAGRIQPKEIPLDQLQKIVGFNKPDLTKRLEKHWGKVGASSSGEKQSRMRSIANMLRNGKGEPAKGKLLFAKTCGVCHVLFNEGAKVGPELTGVDRKNLDFLLQSTVDPSAFIRPEYVAFVVETKDGRVLTGLIVESTPSTVTLLDAKNERTKLSKSGIAEMNPSPQSLMPEKLLDPLDDQEIRDLFSYLRSEGAGK